jgi:histone H2A
MYRLLKKTCNHSKVSNECSVYLTAVLEYISAEILELAGYAARDNRKIGIEPKHIFMGIQNDEKLNKLFKGTFGFGTMPNIHAFMLPPKRENEDDEKEESEDEEDEDEKERTDLYVPKLEDSPQEMPNAKNGDFLETDDKKITKAQEEDEDEDDAEEDEDSDTESEPEDEDDIETKETELKKEKEQQLRILEGQRQWKEKILAKQQRELETKRNETKLPLPEIVARPQLIGKAETKSSSSEVVALPQLIGKAETKSSSSEVVALPQLIGKAETKSSSSEAETKSSSPEEKKTYFLPRKKRK